MTDVAARWTDQELDAMRQIGDVTVDPMAEEIIRGTEFDQTAGRLGYHKLLGLADLLLQAPELLLLDDARVGQALKAMPKHFTDYFDPMPVPDWVDEKKLARASEIWDENMLAIIGVLYAGSLPSCYLIAKGIPTLYDTGKLGQHRFIYQRIYETGLMLDAVMHQDGLKVFSDIPGPDGTPGRRFVWGRGFISARKVRLLHAAMRTMLLNPAQVMPARAHASAAFAGSSIGALTADLQTRPYDVARLGKPVNQEDLAYTLLTFGYTIPVGLRAWGCRLSDDDCDAFLHAWRLVGHIMGVRAELIPDDFTQAGCFYETVKRRQARACPQGPKLTRSLVLFLQEYLPQWMRRDLPMLLIGTQLTKDEVAMIRPPGTRTPPLRMRLLVCVGFWLLRRYYQVKSWLVRRFPPLRQLFGRSFAIAGEALIESWRDGYQRRPFYIPDSVGGSGWQRQPGMDHATRSALRAWRLSLFSTVIAGVTFLVTAALVLLGTLVIAPFLVEHPVWFLILPLVMLLCWITGFSILTWRVGRVVARRPGPQEPGNPDLGRNAESGMQDAG